MGSDAPVNVRLPADLLAFVDQVAAVRFEGNRSLAVRALLRECQARSQPTTDDLLAPIVSGLDAAARSSGPAKANPSRPGACDHVVDGLRCKRCGMTTAQIRAQR